MTPITQLTPFTYSLKKDGDKLVAPNFRVREFASKCGSDRIVIHPHLPVMLQLIRDYFGRPVGITSGYRSPEHNRRVGGAKQSYHVRGMAADFTIKGREPAVIYRAIANGWVSGLPSVLRHADETWHSGIDPEQIGLGLYVKQGFVHIDCRGERSRW